MTGLARRHLLTVGAALSIPATASATPLTVMEEWTFLRSSASDPTALVRFIEQNWFAMDAVAVARGLMTSYALHVADDSGDWNVVVVVGYPQPSGYAGIATEFEKIRAAHVSILVDGKALKELGTITGSRKLRTPMLKVRA